MGRLEDRQLAVPEGAEVHWAKSRTLDDMGLTEILGSDRYDAVRPKYMAMDRQTQGREIAKIMAAPDYMLGSVQAITEAGEMIVVSYAGSQIEARRSSPTSRRASGVPARSSCRTRMRASASS